MNQIGGLLGRVPRDTRNRFLSPMVADGRLQILQWMLWLFDKKNFEQLAEPIRWKYFQWLSLLFTEVCLDRFFRDPNKLLVDLNEFVAKFNEDKLDKYKIPAYELADLRKIAFWNATGSGKTLLMHVNILQYQHYLELHGKVRELNRIILLTPNEGLLANISVCEQLGC